MRLDDTLTTFPKNKKTMKKAIYTMMAIAAMASVAVAGQSYKSVKQVVEPEPAAPCIDGGEFILGLFAGAAIIDDTLEGYDDSFAGGAELLYALTRNFVLGAEYYAFSSEPAHAYNGVLQVRFPVDCFAPYVFGTAGGLVDGENNFTVGGGAGLEYRISNGLGLFTDGRYVYGDDGDETHVFVRAGLRFAF